MKQILTDLISRKDLTNEQSKLFMKAILNGECSDTQIAAYITLLRAKGETCDELYSLVTTMWENMPDYGEVNSENAIDTCGTGGAEFKTFNISTCVSFILAALDIKVAKHGNRAASSTSGAADVLDILGYNLNLEATKAAELFNETGFAFLMAPIFHPGMRHAKTARTELGVRTTFNFLGPLANPFQVPLRMHGVSDNSMVEKYIQTLKLLGVQRAIVYCGENSMDEISINNKTMGKQLKDGQISDFFFDPKRTGFEQREDRDLLGQDPKYNSEIIKMVTSGKDCAQREIVVANAAVGVALAKNVEMEDSIKLVNEALDNKSVEEKFYYLIERSNTI